jgi:hypothetical protein
VRGLAPIPQSRGTQDSRRSSDSRGCTLYLSAGAVWKQQPVCPASQVADCWPVLPDIRQQPLACCERRGNAPLWWQLPGLSRPARA